MAMLNRERKDLLERMIDESSWAGVLESLAEIAHEKAEHIRSTWQDDAMAAQWDQAGKAVTRAKDRSTVA
jgi:hypothetical protein